MLLRPRCGARRTEALVEDKGNIHMASAPSESQPNLGQVINANGTPWKQNKTMGKAGSVHQLFLVAKLKSQLKGFRETVHQ